MTMRKKLLITIACLSCILCIMVTGTIAWLIDSTPTITNTFTPSNITVAISETNSVLGTDGNYSKEFQMIPGKTYTKDPVVTVTNDIDCYVFVKVAETKNIWNEKKVVTYTMGAGWISLGDGVYYRVVEANAQVKEFSVIAGNEVTINGALTKEYMTSLGTDTAKYPSLQFTAYAVQMADGGAENDGNFTPAEAWAAITNP